MKINKMTSYAVRVVGRLYFNSGQVMTSKQIAEAEQIPQGMVMKVFRKLKEAGIVDSKQGRGEITGGFSLKEDAKSLSLYQLISAMEDDICLYPSYEEDLYKGDMHLLYEELERTHAAYVKALKARSIDEVIKEKNI